MTIKLLSLQASGPEKSSATVDFRYPAMLIRGASDTGKSYIRDCLWFLLGGDKLPKRIPEAQGYERLVLVIETSEGVYEIRRALAGGDASLARRAPAEDGGSLEFPEEDVNDFLVRIAGAAGKQLLRSRSKRGAVTSGDLRHWFLLSQPMIISEDPTAGPVTNATQRVGAFHMFLTGSDDSSIELAKSSKDIERIAGQILGVEEALRRVRADIPSDASREGVADSLERVDEALSSMTRHYDARASALRQIRVDIMDRSRKLQDAERERSHSASMLHRFELLDAKYRSDSERLGGTWEGVAMFQALDEVECPLCGTPTQSQLDPRQLRRGVQDNYRKALKAERDKIVVLRQGLGRALIRERARVEHLGLVAGEMRSELKDLEKIERSRLSEAKHEFSGDPKTLALRRSELSETLARFEQEAQFEAELARLNGVKKNKKIPLSRNVGDAAVRVALLAKTYLHAWGFTGVQSVALDAEKCDLVIDGRARLDFGAGKRAIFLAALTIAVMEHAVGSGYPHLGVVVIDSPLKSYADPKNREQQDVEASTVTDRFYMWLAAWTGLGQIVVLENQEIKSDAKAQLDPLEFVGDGDGDGRAGFYPLPTQPQSQSNGEDIATGEADVDD